MNQAKIDDFDDQWYISNYPDVASALRSGATTSARAHYIEHGKAEGRRPGPSRKTPRIVHIHIAKTAGTAVRAALDREGRRIFRAEELFEFNSKEHAEYDVISGHFGYRGAQTAGGEIITVLRNPLDRFLSYYYFLVHLFDTGREISDRTRLVKRAGLDGFIELWDCPHIVEDLFNAVTWQLAYGNRLTERIAYRDANGASEDDLLKVAMENIGTFRLVGLQSSLGDFQRQLNAIYNMNINLEMENVGSVRPAEISSRTRRRIYDWIYLDVELYQAIVAGMA